MATVKETNGSPTFDCLAVTAVQVFPFKNPDGGVNGTLKGFAHVVLNDQLLLRGLRINDGEFRLWVAFPVDPFFKGEALRTLVAPMTRQLREHIENCVLEKYQAAIA